MNRSPNNRLSTKVKIAFAGAGYICNIHAQAAKAQKDVELVAVVEKFPDNAQAFAQKFSIKDQFETVEQMLNACDVDALVVGTPNYLHAPQTIAALNASVHVMVEKPMAMNSREAYQMLEASQISGALLMVAHCWRFDPEVVWLREQAKSGRFGKIIRTKGYGVHKLWGPSGWFTQRKFAGGGAMADVGIHALDTVRFLIGDPQPESVYARISTNYIPSDVDDTGILIVNWEGGVVSYIESGWWQPHTDGPEAATQLYGTTAFGQLFPTYVQEQNQKDDPGFTYPRKEHCPQSLYDDQMAYFIQCIRTNQLPSPGAIEGWINMKIVDAAYLSSETGEVIKVR
jgi:predicted dehydrogenase